MIRKLLFLTAALCAYSSLVYCNIYYVAPTGNNSNAGTMNAPFRTIQQAQTVVNAGDTVYIRGGLYTMQESDIAVTTTGSPVRAYVTNLTKSGTAGNPINYWAYPGEKPKFDYTNVKPLNTRINAFEVSASWLYIKGLEVVGVQVTTAQNINTQSICFSQTGVGGNNKYEQLSMHDGMAIGFYLTRGGNTLVLNCDAYNNWDSISGNGVGGNVDGFGAHPNQESYTGIVFRGCRAWQNSDDGYDCISAYAPITFENCWAWRNGLNEAGRSLGDGNGFKIGGYGTSLTPDHPVTIPRNIVRNCMAANNKANGFYANHHLGGNDWYNNTSYRNSKNFDMTNRSQDYTTDVPGYGHVIKNNIGYSSRTANSNLREVDTSQSTIDFNSFSNTGGTVSGITVNNSDFLSLDTGLIRLPRSPDGSLPNIAVLRLASNSDLIDKGVDVGLPYAGAAPDLGAFENGTIILPVKMGFFIATVINKEVVLQWQTNTETNNRGWDIERFSPEAKKWERIGFVVGKGTITLKATYAFTDTRLRAGKYLYRLKQINGDENSSYSMIRSVSISSDAAARLEVYPIPVQASTVVRYTLPQKSKVLLQLFNTSGQLISTLLNQQTEAGQYQLSFDTNVFTLAGTYTLKMVANRETVSKIIIK